MSVAFGLRWVLVGLVACVSVNSTSGWETSPGCEVSEDRDRRPGGHHAAARPRAPASATGRAGAGTCPEGSVALCATRQMPSTCCAPTRAARGCCAPSRRATGVHLVGGAVRDLLLGRPPRELDSSSRATSTPPASRLGGEVDRPRALRHRARARRRTAPSTSCAPAPRRYAHPGALPDVRPGTLDEDLRRRDVTVNAIALGLGRRAARPSTGALEDLRAGRAARAARRAPSSTTRRASGAWRATPRAWASTSRTRTRALAGAADPATVSGDRLGVRAAPGAQRARPARRAAGRRRRSTRAYLPEGFDPRPRGLPAALALLPDDGRRDLLTLAACTAGMDAGACWRWLDDMGFVAADRDLVAAASRFCTGRAAARRAHQRRDRAGRAGRAGRGGRARRRRERAPLAGRAAPRAPGDQRRRPAGRRRSRRAPRSARGCSARWTASSTASSPAASASWPQRWRTTADRLAAR